MSSEKADVRNVIRKTWATDAYELQTIVVFLLGSHADKETRYPEEPIHILNESKAFNDIVVGNFDENDVNNGPLKSLLFLQWVDKFCPHTKFVFKLPDADALLNLPNLWTFIRKFDNTENKMWVTDLKDSKDLKLLSPLDKNATYFQNKDPSLKENDERIIGDGMFIILI